MWCISWKAWWWPRSLLGSVQCMARPWVQIWTTYRPECHGLHINHACICRRPMWLAPKHSSAIPTQLLASGISIPPLWGTVHRELNLTFKIPQTANFIILQAFNIPPPTITSSRKIICSLWVAPLRTQTLRWLLSSRFLPLCRPLCALRQRHRCISCCPAGPRKVASVREPSVHSALRTYLGHGTWKGPQEPLPRPPSCLLTWWPAQWMWKTAKP